VVLHEQLCGYFGFELWRYFGNLKPEVELPQRTAGSPCNLPHRLRQRELHDTPPIALLLRMDSNANHSLVGLVPLGSDLHAVVEEGVELLATEGAGELAETSEIDRLHRQLELGFADFPQTNKRSL
jgi:hypothetical protein